MTVLKISALHAGLHCTFIAQLILSYTVFLVLTDRTFSVMHFCIPTMSTESHKHRNRKSVNEELRTQLTCKLASRAAVSNIGGLQTRYPAAPGLNSITALKMYCTKYSTILNTEMLLIAEGPKIEHATSA